jgi:predicted nucleotidyltransferase
VENVKTATRTEELVRRTIEYLRQWIRVHQAILFGSHARREANEWSDVDLAVFSPDFARMTHRKLMKLLVETSLAVDPSVEIRPYAPRDLKEARPTNFLGHILAEGKVLYKDGKYLVEGERRWNARRSRRAPQREGIATSSKREGS